MRNLKYLIIQLMYRHSWNKKLKMLCCISLFAYFIISVVPRNEPVNLKYVTVHFDMKGAPLKLKYFTSVLKHIKNMGVDALLIEYEDMFPYKRRIENISSPLHYSRDDLATFLKTAAKVNLEIIPMIQTFNHMEHVLKLAEFAHLREDQALPGYIRMDDQEGLDLIAEMVWQIAKFHNHFIELKHIHIGYKGSGRDTVDYSFFGKITRHIISVAKIAKRIIPTVKIVIWDDLIRRNAEYVYHKDLFEKLGKHVEIIYFDDSPTLENKKNDILNMYCEKFDSVWVASAYKGADGNKNIEPDMERRLSNNLYWMNYLHNHQIPGKNAKNQFKGFILTGYSRHSHFNQLLELFPLSLKSLLTNLMLIQRYRNGVFRIPLHKITLRKINALKKHYKQRYEYTLNYCNKSRSQENSLCQLYCNEHLFETVKKYALLLDEAKIFDNQNRAQLFNYIDKTVLEKQYKICVQITKNLKSLKKSLRIVLEQFFYKETIDEYLDFKRHIVEENLHECEDTITKMWNKNSWKRLRMLPNYFDFDWESEFNRNLFETSRKK